MYFFLRLPLSHLRRLSRLVTASSSSSSYTPGRHLCRFLPEFASRPVSSPYQQRANGFSTDPTSSNPEEEDVWAVQNGSARSVEKLDKEDDFIKERALKATARAQGSELKEIFPSPSGFVLKRNDLGTGGAEKSEKVAPEKLPGWTIEQYEPEHSGSFQNRNDLRTGRAEISELVSSEPENANDHGSDPWADLLEKPEEWCDFRKKKENGSVSHKHPDFKKIDMIHKKGKKNGLWLNKAPKEILPKLKDLPFGTDHWFHLLEKPNEWHDNRQDKQNGSVSFKHPDFKKKDGSVSLWLTQAPEEILFKLNEKKTGEELWDDLIRDLLINGETWWDNRTNKKNAKGPDFVHKQTRVGLWLNACPRSLLRFVPPPKSKQ